jgi:branched-chain amino acid transport system substrate-binding protein
MNTLRKPNKFQHLLVLALLVLAVAIPSASITAQDATPSPEFTGEPIYFGVSGPLTGPNAQYGEQWQKGFDLAVEQINAAGGIDGRELAYVFEDSQSDPTQSVVVAQKFVADPRIIIELGDFSSTASMAASPIYQRGGLVQFGFTNSHPDFTFAGGEYTWSISVTQAQASPALADFAIEDLGLENLAVFHLNSDWGQSSYDLFAQRVEELGANIVSTQAYLPEERDFRSALTNIEAANPDGIILFSYAPDGALIAQQAREAGITVPFIAGGSLQNPDLINLGGEAVEGALVVGQFLPSDTRPEVQAFVESYRAKYDEDPDLFAAIAYDAVNLAAEAIRLGGATREGVLAGLSQIEDAPSVIYGTVTFDPESRRVFNPTFVNLVVEEGQFVPLEGETAAP